MRGYRFWTEEEDTLLIKNYPKMKIREIADVLSRGFYSIHNRAQHLELIGIKAELHGWTDEKTRLLVENYPTMTCIELSDLLGKSFPSVSSKVHKLAENTL